MISEYSWFQSIDLVGDASNWSITDLAQAEDMATPARERKKAERKTKETHASTCFNNQFSCWVHTIIYQTTTKNLSTSMLTSFKQILCPLGHSNHLKSTSFLSVVPRLSAHSCPSWHVNRAEEQHGHRSSGLHRHLWHLRVGIFGLVLYEFIWFYDWFIWFYGWLYMVLWLVLYGFMGSSDFKQVFLFAATDLKKNIFKVYILRIQADIFICCHYLPLQ